MLNSALLTLMLLINWAYNAQRGLFGSKMLYILEMQGFEVYSNYMISYFGSKIDHLILAPTYLSSKYLYGQPYFESWNPNLMLHCLWIKLKYKQNEICSILFKIFKNGTCF